MSYPAVAVQHPRLWTLLFPFWWYGELARLVWACLRAR
jgi:hypothetical protein